jgi:hypothetical protein
MTAEVLSSTLKRRDAFTVSLCAPADSVPRFYGRLPRLESLFSLEE